MKKTPPYLFALLVFAVAILVLSHFFRHRGWEPQPAGPPEKVIIAYAATTDCVLAGVAQVQGYYLQEGLEVIAHLHAYGKPALGEVLEGKADFATVAETPFMFAVMNGAEISIVATIQTASRVNAVVARKDRGILTPGGLKGRTLAVTLGTTADFFLDTFLAVHEIARKDVRVIDLKPDQIAGALIRGEVDAVSVFMPIPIKLQRKLGDRAIAFYDENIYTSMFNVVATRKFIRENPEKVKKLLRALIRAEEYVSRNQALAQRIVVDFSKMDAALVRQVWDEYSYTVKLDQSLVLALEEETQWAIKGGLVGKQRMPDYLDYIYLPGLESVKPESVRILR
jgi:sulfonate transport system substrate-binding protein